MLDNWSFSLSDPTSDETPIVCAAADSDPDLGYLLWKNNPDGPLLVTASPSVSTSAIYDKFLDFKEYEPFSMWN